ncbi:MAG: hypothetical protein NVS4B6_25830 [Mycobacterium sp.]
MPTISFPDDLMASGTVFAIASTFSAFTVEGAVVGPLDWLLLEQPDSRRAPVAANTAAMRHNFLGPP